MFVLRNLSTQTAGLKEPGRQFRDFEMTGGAGRQDIECFKKKIGKKQKLPELVPESQDGLCLKQSCYLGVKLVSKYHFSQW